MKYSLTINTDDADELASVLAMLQGDDDNAAPRMDAPAVDSAGLPWDDRIHIKSKGTNKDGTWTNKRGLKDDVKATVVNELRARMGGQQVAPQQQYAQVPQQYAPVQQAAPQQYAPVQQAAPQQYAPVQQAAPQQYAPVQQQPTGGAPAMDMNAFFAALGPRMANGTITEARLNPILNGLGLASMNDIMTRQDLIPAIINALALQGMWQ